MSGSTRPSSPTVEIRLLGAMEVRVNDRIIAVTAAQQRVAVAALALAAGHPVTLDRLQTLLWPDQVPATARTSVHNIIRRLRTTFEEAGAAGLIATSPEGYRLDLQPDQVDAVRFSRLVGQAREDAVARRTEPAVAGYREALALWRGEPLPDLANSGWFGPVLEQLTESWVTATEEWAELEITLGSAEPVVERLAPMIESWPWRETLRAQLMLALQAAGRTAEALAEYVRAREQFVEQLGVEPGPALRAAHAQVLRLDAEEAEGPSHFSPLRPAQLPSAAPGLVGRDAELARLAASLPDVEGAAPVSWVISGPAGVGKTTLAVHWASSLSEAFPDGQLYVNLRGFDPQGQPLQTTEAVRGFLTGLGVPPENIPPDLDGAIGAFRSLLVGRRVLVVLDNARDAAQVRPLLPTATGCLAIVTSRNDLASLAVTDHARLMSLQLLDTGDAVSLLRDRLGTGMVADDVGALTEILDCCGGLPLALAVAAARVAARGDTSLAALADQLRSASSLDVLHLGDPNTDVRGVLSWSIDALAPEASHVFTMMGLHPSPELTEGALASLAGLPLRRTRAALEELNRAHLVTSLDAGRFTCHDLLRTQALELAETQSSESDRTAALRRLLDHYLRAAHTATRLQFSTPLSFELGSPLEGVAATEFASLEQATTWLEVNHPALVIATELAAATPGLETYAWRLARTLNGFAWDRCQWSDMLRMHEAALAAAERTQDRFAEADTRHGLGEAAAGLGQFPEAEAQLERSLQIFIELGEDGGESDVHCTLGRVLEPQGRFAEALQHTEAALSIYRATDDRPGQAVALNNIGWLHACLGDFANSLARCLEALEIYRAVGDRTGQTYALDSIGRAYQGLGEQARAITSYSEAAGLAQHLGQHYNRATNLTHLGEAYHAAGDTTSARAAWATALEILDALGHPTAEVVRSRLRLLEPTSRTEGRGRLTPR